jgi:hypothetical protein
VCKSHEQGVKRRQAGVKLPSSRKPVTEADILAYADVLHFVGYDQRVPSLTPEAQEVYRDCGDVDGGQPSQRGYRPVPRGL